MSNESTPPGSGTVYTETVVYSAPEAFAGEAPYQLAIIALDAGGRLTVRIADNRVQIGDRAEFVEFRKGVPFYRKAQ
jgi:uncharacterized OB-fold protein